MYFSIIGQAFKIFWQKKYFYFSVLGIQIAMLILANIYYASLGLNPLSLSVINSFNYEEFSLISFIAGICNIFISWMVARFAYINLMEEKFVFKDNVIIILKRLFKIIATIILYYLLILLGFVAFIIPAIIIGYMFIFASYGVLLENKEVMDSLKDSRKLTKGFKFDIFATANLLLLPLYGLNFISGFLGNPFLIWILMIAAIIMQPIYTNVLVIWYYRLTNHVAIIVEQSGQPDSEGYVEGEYRPFCPNCMKIYDKSLYICPQCGVNLERQ